MVPPTPIMTDIIVKIMVGLLSVLALATKQINQRRFSKCAVTYIASDSMCHRENRGELLREQQDRGRTPKIGPTESGRGTDDCCTDIVCGPRSCG
jgi:hypothetical protein